MDMKIVGITVAVLVSLTVLAGVLMPVLDDATDTEDTFKNAGSAEYKYISAGETYKLEWYYSTPTKVTVNDTVIDAITGNEALAMGDFTLRIYANNTNGYAQWILADNESGVTANASQSQNLSFSYEDGTITVTNGTVTKTLESDGFYAIVPEGGTHTMKEASSTAYVKSDVPLLVMGITSIGSQWNTGYMIDGTITDYSVEQWTGPTSYAPTDVSDDSVKIDGYNGLYSIKEFKWKTDNNGTPVNVTYNRFLVPLEVTAEKSEHLSNNQIELLDVIPVLVIVAILLGVIALVIRSRLD